MKHKAPEERGTLWMPVRYCTEETLPVVLVAMPLLML